MKKMATFRELSGLEDIFPGICADVSAGVPFAFSRFGDGEFLAIAGRGGANCDGHEYFADMGERLRGVLAGEPRYRLGTLPRVFVEFREEISSLAGNVEWVSSLCMRDAVLEGRFGDFFAALEGKDVTLAGPPHLCRLAASRAWSMIEVPPKNCWLDYANVRAALEQEVASGKRVFLFCASMMSNVLIDDLHRLDSRHTYLDVGSALDPFAGVKSRPYHERVEPDIGELS